MSTSVAIVEDALIGRSFGGWAVTGVSTVSNMPEVKVIEYVVRRKVRKSNEKVMEKHMFRMR